MELWWRRPVRRIPDLIATAAQGSDKVLFNELVNYAASHAYEHVPFHAAGTRADRHGRELQLRGATELYARLPRLAHLFLSRVEH